MPLDNYSRVRLLTDNYVSEGLQTGDIGSVIEIYDNGEYEVEFADADGVDFAQIVAYEAELQVIQPIADSRAIISGAYQE